MTKLLLILFISFLANQIKSQVVFCPPGAEWRYIFRVEANPDYLSRISCTGTTTTNNGDTVKLLQFHDFYYYSAGGCGSALIKQKGDTVFMLTCNTRGTWQILYNFAAGPGQSWTTMHMDSSYGGDHTPVTTTVMVNAVSTVTINGMSLKRLKVNYCYMSPFSGALQCDTADIIERIGCTTYLFNYVNRPTISDWNTLRDFLCYKDNALGTKEFSQKGCDYAVGINAIKTAKGQLSIYPNPASSVLNIDVESNTQETLTVSFIDLYGREVKRIKLEQLNNNINVKDLGNGIYLLKISNKDNEVLYQDKFLKAE